MTEPTNLDSALRGKTAIVTGSGRNIGKAIALRLAREGANIVVNGSSNRAAIDAVATEIEALGVGAMSCPIGLKHSVQQPQAHPQGRTKIAE
jgi:NAD(P)-dependent dehydrogenase (short-subunit alcohol dehydrogenase family)